MQIFIFSTISLGLVILGALALILGFQRLRENQMVGRVKEYAGTSEIQHGDRSGVSSSVRRFEIQGSFVDRTFRVFVERAGNFLSRRTPISTIEEIDEKLRAAGNPYGLRVREFLLLHFLFFLAGIVGSFLILNRGISLINILASVSSVSLAILFPIFFLFRQVRIRQEKIIREFPEVIEILSISTNAGLSFSQALQRVSDIWHRHTVMGVELSQVVNEMEMGLSRTEALRNLSNRIKVDDVSSFVSIIIQSEQLGMSMSGTLSALAEQMRTERYFRVKEDVQKIPVKILIPLAFLIFPALLLIILGPSIPPLLGLFNAI